jgi:hypothetical protein
MPVRLIPSAWLNWVANFFNTADWIGFDVNFTSSGAGSTIETVGATETMVIMDNQVSTTESTVTIVNGLITSVVVIP